VVVTAIVRRGLSFPVPCAAAPCHDHAVWLNPPPQKWWEHSASTKMIHQVMSNRMFPLTLEGLDGAMQVLSR
jgi:uncharacterized protein with von Willebrand factor type A (vWA) domain